MSNVTVFVFLLEGFVGLENHLNSSFFNITNGFLSKCDPSDKANIIWKYNNNKSNLLQFRKEWEMNRYKIHNTSSDSDSYQKYPNNPQNNYLLNEINTKSQEDLESFRNYSKVNIYNKYVPRRTPFLVALFETFLNITAQTCAASLVTSQWVLTSTSCLDLLYHPHKNISNNSYYTIIANANNPLVDGTVHNVTEVILNQKYVESSMVPSSQRKFQRISDLALMKIEPAVKIKSLHLFQSKVIDSIYVRVYGWIVKKNLSGQDVMSAASFGAKIVDISKCKDAYKRIDERHIICIMAKNNKYVNQMNSGGPVIIFHQGSYQILAVAELSGSRFIAYSLKPYHDWIYNVIYKKI